jgi:uncharacterized membrane protein
LKIKLGSELYIINILSLVLLLIVHFLSHNFLRVVLGIPLVLFFPGYVMTIALFPRKEGVDFVQRIAISFGASIAMVVMTGLIVNFTPFGLRLEPLLWSLIIIILILSIIAWFRLRKLSIYERFTIPFFEMAPEWGKTTKEKMLIIVLFFAIIGVLVSVGYVTADSKVGEHFTEFYILDSKGEIPYAVTNLTLGQNETVTVGITNHEGKTIDYRIEVTVNGINVNEIKGIILVSGQKWENPIVFTPQIADSNTRVDFTLFEDNETSSTLDPLQLILNVTK